MSAHIIRSLEGLMRLANAGEFHDQFHQRLTDLQRAVQFHLAEYEAGVTGGFTLKCEIKADRYGEIDITFTPKFQFPQPPDPKGRGRAFLGADGTVTRHPQQQMDLIRDVSPDRQDVRDIPPTDRKEA